MIANDPTGPKISRVKEAELLIILLFPRSPGSCDVFLVHYFLRKREHNGFSLAFLTIIVLILQVRETA